MMENTKILDFFNVFRVLQPLGIDYEKLLWNENSSDKVSNSIRVNRKKLTRQDVVSRKKDNR